jgi:hypothetical protein
LYAATGEIVAYIDDDAYPDPHWLKYLAVTFRNSEHAGIGGPNIAPPNDGDIADCIANAPGGPVHVLLTDEVAEHIPGCNMAYRRNRLIAIAGFDPRFRVAGDDVDVCWRLQERGWTLGFSPAALVWHHRRNSIERYLKQQRGYAKAEALLTEKWPAKYNSAGHLTWHGRLYGRGNIEALLLRPRIYHGTWGSALFQSVYEPAPGLLSALPLMPEWYVLLTALGILAAFGFAWPPFLALVPVFVTAAALTIAQAVRGARKATFDPTPQSRVKNLRLRAVVASLYLLQPIARLLGRMQPGLGSLQHRDFARIAPVPRLLAIWCECWASTEERLTYIEALLQRSGADVRRGGNFDRWDLAIRGGLLGSVRTMAMVEEHGAGKQLFRVRAWPRVPAMVTALVLALTTTAVFAGLDQAWIVAVPLAGSATAVALWAYADCALAMKRWSDAVEAYTSVER